MRRKILLPALSGCLLSLMIVSGCSTVWTLASGVREPYSGTKIDACIINSPDATCFETFGAVLDFPLSLVADALVVVFMRPEGVEQLVSPEYD